MAAPALRRLAWIGAAVLAAGLVAGLALHGQRPEAGIARYEARGVMVHLPPGQVTAVEVAREGRRWRFERGPGGGWAPAPGAPAPPSPGEAVDLGLRLLHGSVPQRVMTREEVRDASLAELGLAPPRCTVSVFGPGPAPFVLELGGPNPQGLAWYARVRGQEEVLLLNHYVGEQWEKVIGAR